MPNKSLQQWLWLEDIDSDKSLDWVNKQNQQTTSAALEQESCYSEIYRNSLDILVIEYPGYNGQPGLPLRPVMQQLVI